MNDNVNEANRIFDAFGKMSEAIQLQDEIRRKRETIQNFSAKRCGNCSKWMTGACPLEYYVDRRGNPSKNGGMKMGPNCNQLACDQFSVKSWYVERAKELQEELDKFIAEKVKTLT